MCTNSSRNGVLSGRGATTGWLFVSAIGLAGVSAGAPAPALGRLTIKVIIPRATSDTNPIVLASYAEAGIGGWRPAAAVWSIRPGPLDKAESTCAFLCFTASGVWVFER